MVEVVSPGNRRADHHTRRHTYLNAGVPVYWIVDPEARHVERWRPGDERPEVITQQIEWQAPGLSEPLVISLPELFAAATGEE